MELDAVCAKPRHTIAMPTPSSPAGPGAVVVSYADTNRLAAPGLAARADGLLVDADRTRRDRFRHDADRRMFVLGRVMARVLVGRAIGCAPLDWTWREGPQGRPEIAAPISSVRFNVAHSAGLVVCAVALDRDVGIDVEHLARRTPEPGIVERYCAPPEVADIRSHGPDWNRRFLVYWTLKEAYLKARGLGIAVPLADVAFTIDGDARARIGFLGSLSGTDDRWSFTMARPTAEHLIAVAASTADGCVPDVAIREVDVEELLA